jgi:hypothetical protein
MPYHLDKTHKCQVAVMLHNRSAGRFHAIAAPASYISPSILPVQSLYKIAAMQIATGLARYDVVLHCYAKIAGSKGLRHLPGAFCN